MNKKFTLLTMLVLSIVGLSLNSFAQTTDLIISEYAEGSSSNKYIELYNGTGATIDLSNYEMWKISNGGSWPESTVSLSGMLLDGDVIVIANSSADTAITNLSNATTAFNTATFFNGDDAVGLAKDNGSGTFLLIDAVGTSGPDPGSGWDVAGTTNATANHTMVRKPCITSPDTTWSVTAGTTIANSEWIVYPQNTWTYAGVHDTVCSVTSPTSNDTINPYVMEGVMQSATSIVIVFSETVDATTAQNTSNYTLAPGISVTSAVLNSSLDSVTLTLSPGMTSGTLYTADIVNVTDTSLNANVMDPFNTSFYFNSYAGTDLMITEIYHSQSSSGVQDIDYFELYNSSSSAISLAGMEITSGVGMDINTNLVLAGNSYLIFVENIDSFNLAFPSVTNVVEYDFGSLSGGGETITFENSLGATCASVSYMTAAPWPSWSNTEAIELCDLTTDYTDGANWNFAGTVSSTVANMLYGTPGSANSCAAPPTIYTYDIATVRTYDANGELDSIDVYCALEGIVHGVDLDGNNGLSFFITDGTHGINVFNFNDVDAYVVTEGDEIRVVGEIQQYNGLAELFVDSITILSTGNCIPFATIVNSLSEDTEGNYIEFKNVTVADPSQWPSPGNNSNIDIVTMNGDTITMRLDKDTQIQDSILSAPSGTFNLIGIGGQFDNSSPYLSGYQIFPMFVTDFDSTDYSAISGLQINEVAITNMLTFPDDIGNYHQWAELFNSTSNDIILSGYFLSTDSTDVFMEVFPRCFNNGSVDLILDAGEYGVGFLNTDGTGGPAHFEIEMTVANPFIGLYTANGTLVDALVFPSALAVEGHTFGAKNDDHAQGDVTFITGTPEATNANGTILSVINAANGSDLIVYPNPVTNGNVNFSNMVSFTLYSITGQVILTKENVNQMDVSNLNQGVYLIETTDGDIVRLIVK